jgi:hypothetical protein
MSEPHAQDEATWPSDTVDVAVTPPAPANQWTEHDGGIEPAPPSRNSTARAVRNITEWFVNLFGWRSR